jgi:hypothetical protein
MHPVRISMASSKTGQSESSLAAVENTAAPPAMDSELLMAANHGDHKHLTRLLGREDQVAAVPEHPTSVVGVASPAAIVGEIDRRATTSSAILEGVTPDGDSALHVVAASGDGGRYRESAKVIYGNRSGSNVEMLSLLIELASRTDETSGGGDGNGTGVEAILRMQNGVGETALHEAIRADHTRAVDVLMSADPCLARRHQVGVASPLFLAVSLCRYGLAQKLYERDNQLSYSGPGGQNALHAAALRNKGTHGTLWIELHSCLLHLI